MDFFGSYIRDWIIVTLAGPRRTIVTSRVTTRAETTNNLLLPYHRTNHITKSYAYDTAKCWNAIPANIKLVKNSNTFKEKLHKYFLNQ